jgi:hypothetical protein
LTDVTLTLSNVTGAIAASAQNGDTGSISLTGLVADIDLLITGADLTAVDSGVQASVSCNETVNGNSSLTCVAGQETFGVLPPATVTDTHFAVYVGLGTVSFTEQAYALATGSGGDSNTIFLAVGSVSDPLTVTYTYSATPEPGSLIPLSGALVALVFVARKRLAARDPRTTP